MRYGWFAAMVLSLPLAAACSDGPAPAPAATPHTTPSTVQVDERDDGRAVQLARGETLTIALHPGSEEGYIWSADPVEPALLSPVCSPTLTPADTTGAERTDRFTYIAGKAGTVALRLGYRRGFALDTAPTRTFTVTVTVN